MDKNHWIGEIVKYPIEQATTNLETLIMTSNRLHKLNREEGIYFANGVSGAVKEVTKILTEDENFKDTIPKNRDILLRSFTYFFDKGLEIVYNLRIENEKVTDFDLNDLVNGMGGDKIPEYIQLKVTPIIPKIAQIFNSTIKFIETNKSEIDKSEMVLSEIVQGLILSGAQLGAEFCLQLDLDNQDEMEQLLQN